VAATSASRAPHGGEGTRARGPPSTDSVDTASFLPRRRAQRRYRFPPPGRRGAKTVDRRFYLCALARRSTEEGTGVPGGVCACVVQPRQDSFVYHSFLVAAGLDSPSMYRVVYPIAQHGAPKRQRSRTTALTVAGRVADRA